MYLNNIKPRKIWIRKKKGDSKKKSSTRATLVTLPQNQCLASGMPSFLQNIRQDAFIQSQIDQRLRDLAQNTNAVQKLNLLGMALRKSWFRIVLNGPKNFYCLALRKKGFNMINSQ